MLQNASGQNDACKGFGPQVDCKTDGDCTAAASMFTKTYPMCAAKLMGANCVEGTCRRGVFNFWTVIPRVFTDLVVQ